MSVKLYHGETVIEVHPSKVDYLIEGGWSKSPPKKKTPPSKPAK